MWNTTLALGLPTSPPSSSRYKLPPQSDSSPPPSGLEAQQRAAGLLSQCQGEAFTEGRTHTTAWECLKKTVTWKTSDWILKMPFLLNALQFQFPLLLLSPFLSFLTSSFPTNILYLFPHSSSSQILALPNFTIAFPGVQGKAEMRGGPQATCPRRRLSRRTSPRKPLISTGKANLLVWKSSPV